MPIFEFKCKQCNKITELVIRLSNFEKSKVVCSDCNIFMERVEIPERIGIAFKTGGFYKVDNKKDG
jgi:putative regulatory protein, FmdB family